METMSSYPVNASHQLSENDEHVKKVMDFDSGDYQNIMESQDFDESLGPNGDYNGRGSMMSLNDSDFDQMMNHFSTTPQYQNSSSLQNSSDLLLMNSVDHLAAMPIVEVDDTVVEKLLNIGLEENIDFQFTEEGFCGNQEQTQRPEQTSRNQNDHDRYDGSSGVTSRSDHTPRQVHEMLLGRRSGGRHNSTGVSHRLQNAIASSSLSHHRSQQGGSHRGASAMNDMSPQVDSLQRLIDEAVTSSERGGNTSQAVAGNQETSDPLTSDLQQERQRLLYRLNEIQNGQSAKSSTYHHLTYNQANAVADGTHPFYPRPTATTSIKLQEQQGHAQQNTASAFGAAASIANNSSKEETPLMSFLRRGQKGGEPVATASSLSASMMSRQPASLEGNTLPSNNYSLDQNARQQRLIDPVPIAMDRLQLLRDSGPRQGQHARTGVLPRSSNMANALWGVPQDQEQGERKISNNYFKTSGVAHMPKHTSESNLLRSSTRFSSGGGSLTKSRSKQSLSRENLRFHRQGSSENVSLHGISPIKRRHGSKHKLNVSRSGPNLLMKAQGGGSQGDLQSTSNNRINSLGISNNGTSPYYGNAVWR